MALRFGRAVGGAAFAAILAASLAVGLAGCSWGPEPAATMARPTVTVEMLVGNWGLAAYHQDADRARTETQARAQCNKPFVITKGPNGGVMMYLADSATPTELVIKVGDGKTYIGPSTDPAGGPSDRLIVSADNNEFVTQWVDPEVASRYGTMVYARCGAK